MMSDAPRGPVPEGRSCRVCGAQRQGLFCPQCNHYDVWVNRHAFTAWTSRALLLAGLTGLGGVAVDFVLRQSEQRRKERDEQAEQARREEQARAEQVRQRTERSRELLLGHYDRAYQDAGRLREELSKLLARRTVLDVCPNATVKACQEYFRLERNAIQQHLFRLNWSVPNAFAAQRGTAMAAADNAWDLSMWARPRVGKNDEDYARCLINKCKTSRHKKITLDRRWYRRLENYCLGYLGCVVAKRELEVRDEMITKGMTYEDLQLTRSLVGPSKVDVYCTEQIEQRASLCGTRDLDPKALADAICAQQRKHPNSGKPHCQTLR